MTSELAFFSLLVQQGSLARAARELGLTGPAVSRRLAQLEQRLGVRLLARTTRRMSLTPEGELYLAESRRILGEIEALEQALNRTRPSRAVCCASMPPSVLVAGNWDPLSRNLSASTLPSISSSL